MAMVPDLEPHCGSWVIVHRETGEAVMETFNRSTAEKVNQSAFEVVTALQWLDRVNKAGNNPFASIVLRV